MVCLPLPLKRPFFPPAFAFFIKATSRMLSNGDPNYATTCTLHIVPHAHNRLLIPLPSHNRYVQNPAHWGPKSRHGRPPVDHQASQQGKRKRQQGKGQGQQGGQGEGEKPQEGEGEGAEGEEAQEGQAEAGEAGEGKAEAEQQPQPQQGGVDGEVDTKKQRVA